MFRKGKSLNIKSCILDSKHARDNGAFSNAKDNSFLNSDREHVAGAYNRSEIVNRSLQKPINFFASLQQDSISQNNTQVNIDTCKAVDGQNHMKENNSIVTHAKKVQEKPLQTPVSSQ